MLNVKRGGAMPSLIDAQLKLWSVEEASELVQSASAYITIFSNLPEKGKWWELKPNLTL